MSESNAVLPGLVVSLKPSILLTIFGAQSPKRPAYQVCWVQLKSGEIYAGKIARMQFLGNKLTLTATLPVVKVERRDPNNIPARRYHDPIKTGAEAEAEKWRILTPLRYCAAQTFDNCRKVPKLCKNDEDVYDSNGDQITLSNRAENIALVEILLSQKP
ncbi:MAG: hypothetical protein NTZ38_01090 [Candidatus Taylorbacteria bacterium]|nr:hypothetical protein [Candidatus Taylorbacteria bacterium]